MDAAPTKKVSTHKSWPSTATIVSPPPNSPKSPCSPAKTAELWDGYERMAVEKAKERAGLSHRLSEPRQGLPSRISLDPNSTRRHTAMPATTMSICKTCQHPITYASGGICERCIKTIVVPRPGGEATPPLSPASFTDGASPSQPTPREDMVTPSFSSPKRPSYCPLPSHAAPALLNRRKKSPSEPNQPRLHLDTSTTITSSPSTTRTHLTSPPITPTSTSPHPISPIPPPTTHSLCSTRRSSLANVTMVPKPSYLHMRNDSGTPSEFSTLFQTVSSATTPPGSLHRFGYPLQNATSVWDDWDTEEEEDEEAEAEAERGGIVAAWMGGRRKGKSASARGKSSLEGQGQQQQQQQQEGGGVGVAEEGAREVQSVRERRSASAAGSAGAEKVRKPSGILRALSCGCGGE